MDPLPQVQLTIDVDSEQEYSGDPRGHLERTRLPATARVTVTESAGRQGKDCGSGRLAASVMQLYGQPDSRSPSTKDGQPLELWYYAFDWAGPDVPQVMEVVCTREKDGQAGRVVEITLAAPSL